jgi:hypothetical protein
MKNKRKTKESCYITKKTKSNYIKKKPANLLIIDDDEDFSPLSQQNLEETIASKKNKVIQKKVKKIAQTAKLLIIDDNEELMPSDKEKTQERKQEEKQEEKQAVVEQTLVPEKIKRKRTKKQKIILKGYNKTKKNS